MRHRTFELSPADASLPPERGVDLLVLFADRRSGPQVAEAGLRARFPGAVIVGASTAGEITGARVGQGGIVAAALSLEHAKVRRAEVALDLGDEVAGFTLARALVGPGLRGVLVLCDGEKVNGSALVRGLERGLGPGVVMGGGLAGDGDRFGETWTLDADGLPRRGRVTAVGFYGERVDVRVGTQGGWNEFGPERRITRAEHNTLYELDGRPALELYKRYLGDRAAGLPAAAMHFPLQVRADEGSLPVVRTILHLDEEKQSLTFAGEVPEGGLAKLMRANPERLIDGAAGAAPALSADLPAFATLISCVGRRLALGARTEEEVEAVLANLPPGSTQVGFYSYGEIGPSGIACGDRSALHNQSMTVFTLQER